MKALVLIALTALAFAGGNSPSWASPVVYSAAGSTAASIQADVDAFRASLGALNPNVSGSFASGRREINWDGVPDAFSAPNNLPGTFFNVNSPRGVVLSTPGTGFQVSATVASGTPVEFGNIDPSYPGLFATFSPQRLFTALGSNIVDVNFFVPGSATQALTNGFGVVFTDVDIANTTGIQFFDAQNQSLGTFFAPNFVGDQTLSFLGVIFSEGRVISRARITSGNQILASGNTSNDLVVMDDFIFGEPMVNTVPEPAPLTLMLVALMLGGALRLRDRSWTQCSAPG